MEQRRNDMERFGGSRTPRIWSGFFLIIAGVLLLAYKMGAPIPDWVFTWPVLLISIGLLLGLKSGFRNPGGFILLVIGGIFLIDQVNPELNFHNYILPAILIAVGLIYVLRPRHSCGRRARRWRERQENLTAPTSTPGMENTASTSEFVGNKAGWKPEINERIEEAEYLDINAVLGGVKKMVLSKNFKGGEINCFMGGAEVNLVKADILQPITLDVNNVFGGTKLIVPSDWYVKNNITAILGGVEDKRSVDTALANPQKVLELKGACIFGGIEISNF